MEKLQLGQVRVLMVVMPCFNHEEAEMSQLQLCADNHASPRSYLPFYVRLSSLFLVFTV